MALAAHRPPQQTQQARADPAPAPAPATPKPGILLLSTIPVGRLYVDDVRSGSSFTGLNGIQLAPGHHVIKVEQEGYEPLVREQDVAPGDTVRILGIKLQHKRP